jgi:arylsulfatase
VKQYVITGFAGIVTATVAGYSAKSDILNKKPNIVFILADDLGYGDPGCYGQKIIETPNIDALANNGIRFTQYYSGSPVSAPSRCILLTGKHSGHSFIRGNGEWPERGHTRDLKVVEENPILEGQYPIPSQSVTFSKVLQARGYKTACIGKWGLGAPFTEGAPNKQGFDLFFGYYCQWQAHTYYPGHLWRNDEKVKLNNELVEFGTRLEKGADPNNSESYARFNQKEYAPELMLKEALSFIQTNKDKPLFLHFTTIIPHVSLQAPQEWVDKYRKKIGEEQPFPGDNSYFPCQYPRATYAGMVGYLDYQVGCIVQELKKQGIYENTIIIFSSDNGPTRSGGGSESTFFENAKPFNQNAGRLKGTVYEGGIRVPLIISWPEKIKKGQVSNHICAAWDIFPTICDISGSKHPENLDGISIMPTILQHGNQKKHKYLYWEFPEGGGQQAVRLDNWKAIRNNTRSGNLKLQLYNLGNDITEESDVANQYPEICKQMEEIMKTEHQKPELKIFDIFVAK